MIDRTALLSDLQTVLRSLEADLLDRTESTEVPEVGEWLRAEYQKAKDAERTAHTYKQWLDDFITQVAAAWVLSCVFVRFLEDNELIDPPRIAGAGARLDRARDEHTLFFQDAERAKLTDREYLLDIFDGLAQSSAGKDVFGPHNPLRALPNWLGPDAAGELLRFFQKIDSDSGDLVHDFTDPATEDRAGWDTRFLGDLYQDLSEAARKKYALLQTPDFVEEFILDRTLEPALDEFGLEPRSLTLRVGSEVLDSESQATFKMIDPACGSGHFLLGSFPRILRRWQQQEPGTNVRVLVQRTLDSIHGVDINPFAIAIARFRLLLAALAACGVKRLADAPAFAMNLACGDSLYHGVERQQTLGDWTDESHYFRTEDAENLRRILQEGTFHAVVANPPYITPKDRAAASAYRRLYSSCHRQYSLSVPFMERIFRLCVRVDSGQSGFTGQITANSFMKREFGKKLVEEFVPSIDLTHVIDTSLAYVPGHGTPTVILLGRNRSPISDTIRAALGIKREDGRPSVPREGAVWSSILEKIDTSQFDGEYITVTDRPRDSFARHPWTLTGGGASELKELVEQLNQTRLVDYSDEIGRTVSTQADDIFVNPLGALRRQRIEACRRRRFVAGDEVRDWVFLEGSHVVFPYDQDGAPIADANDECLRFLWHSRQRLASTLMFGGKTKVDVGMNWFEFGQWLPHRFRTPLTIVYAFVSTHNHFVLDDGGRVFNRSAVVVKLAGEAATDREIHIGLVGALNCSVALFWMRQVFHDKGGGGIGGGIAAETWERFFEFDGTKIKTLPIPSEFPRARTSAILRVVDALECSIPMKVLASLSETALSDRVENARQTTAEEFGNVVRLQEDLDWECYRLYGLLEDDLTYPTEQSFGIRLGERAFEIVLARRMARGEVQTTWFERHGSQPITELPAHWPDEYKQLVQRRIDIIESNPQIALIEQPEYKRRWNTTPWEEQVEKALKSWLLDRLEAYFDFDGRMNDEGKATAQIDISLISVAKLADIARQDEQFMEVAEVYRDDPAFDVQKLVEELVKGEHVPLLPVLRYKPNGLRNRAEWEKTWELQRLEDKLRAGEDVRLSDYELTDQQRDDIAGWQQSTPENQRADDRALDAILSIPVPPKYKSSDFISSGGARYWALRGKLDVPKERWVSFPHCEGPDGTLMIAWAGYNHLQLATAISAYFVDVQERLGGTDDPRLVPLLGGIIELLPWLKQWHHDIDPEYSQRMDEVYEGFVAEEAKNLDMTIDEIKAWEPPKKTGRKKRKS